MSASPWSQLIDLARLAQTRDLAAMGAATQAAGAVQARIEALEAQILAEGHLGATQAPELGAQADRWRQAALLRRAGMEQELRASEEVIAERRAIAARATARLEALKLLEKSEASAARRLAERRAEAAVIR